VTARRIDTHHHALPKDYVAWLRKRGVEAAGGLPLPEWSPEGSLAAMDKFGVETAILSLSAPGVHFGDDQEARDKARAVNEYVASVVRVRPDRFGCFATLCLPDVKGSLDELRYAFDVLHCDGVILLANSRGVYLGDPRFDELFDELDRRSAVVFVHPDQLYGAEPVRGVPPFVADFLLDTTRAAVKLAGSGTLERCPNLKVILSHAGGFVPYAAHRLAFAASPSRSIADGVAQLSKFYFDTALSGSPAALPSLLAFAAPDHVLFGSDHPHAPDFVIGHFTEHYEQFPIDSERRASLDRGAAERLFPRLAKRT
jgi:predicted TIM-barrel fold metal-dependent hydrolase